MEMGSSGERLVPNIQTAAWELLGLPTGSMEQILIILNEQYSHVVAFILGEEN